MSFLLLQFTWKCTENLWPCSILLCGWNSAETQVHKEVDEDSITMETLTWIPKIWASWESCTFYLLYLPPYDGLHLTNVSFSIKRVVLIVHCLYSDRLFTNIPNFNHMNSLHSIMNTSEVKHGLKYPDDCMPCVMNKQIRECRVHQNEEIESLGNICIKKYIKMVKKKFQICCSHWSWIGLR